MAGTVVPDMTLISNADATTGWSGSPTLDTEQFIEGTGSLSAKISKTTADFVYTLATRADIQGGIIVGWVFGASVAQFDTKANGGIAMRVEAEVRNVINLAAGYVDCVAGDIGRRVTDDGVDIGQLLAYDNVAYEWTIESVTLISSGSVMLVVGGTGSATTNTTSTTIANNYGVWYLAGSDQGYAGGWIPFAVHTDQTYDEISASFTLGPSPIDIDYIGWSFSITGSASKINTWWDVMYFGNGLTLTGGTSVSPATFEDFMTDPTNGENIKKYGIIEKKEGVYFIQGKIILGDNITTDDTYFQDNSKVCVFKDNPGFPTNFYELNFVGNATGTTEIYLGDETTGGEGVSGFVVSDGGDRGYSMDLSDINITKFGLRGCTFQYSDIITLQVSNADKKILSCTFEECDEILPSTMLVQYCKFISSPGNAIQISTDLHNVKDAQFINCVNGVHLSSTTTPIDFINLLFSGCTFDVNNTSGITITVNKLNGSNPSTYTGTLVIFSATFALTLTDLIEGAQVTIVNSSTRNELQNNIVSATGIVTYSHSGGEIVDILLMDLDYDPNLSDIFDLTLPNGDSTIKFQMIDDINFSNPA